MCLPPHQEVEAGKRVGVSQSQPSLLGFKGGGGAKSLHHMGFSSLCLELGVCSSAPPPPAGLTSAGRKQTGVRDFSASAL